MTLFDKKGSASMGKNRINNGFKPTLNLGLKTEQAKLALVRYISDLNLRPGDKLPSQETIRAELGLGNATITRALNELKQDGVLATKRRIGTYVLDSNADGHPARIIGIGAFQSGDPGVGPFYSCLLHHMLTHLTESNCQAIIFHCRPTYGKWGIELDYFPGLKRNVEQKRLDGIILMADISSRAWSWLEERQMYPVFVGANKGISSGVMIDYRQSVREAIRILFSNGVNRPAVIMYKGLTSASVKSEFIKLTGNRRGFNPRKFYFAETQAKGTPPKVIEKIYSLPKNERPDGLAILDDQLANEIITEITRRRLAGDDYLPKFVVQTNKQIPIAFPIEPIAKLEVDVDVLASNVVAFLIDKLRNRQSVRKIIWISPAVRLATEAKDIDINRAEQIVVG